MDLGQVIYYFHLTLHYYINPHIILQWHDLSMWGDLKHCEVQVNGLPGCSWSKSLSVSEEGRALIAGLLAQLTDKQITDLFTASRANLMRNDSIENWISGFKDKLNRDILSVKC